MFILKTLICVLIFGCICSLGEAVGFFEGSPLAQFIGAALVLSGTVAAIGTFLVQPKEE